MKIRVSERELLDPGYRRAYLPTGDIEHVARGESALAGLKRGQRIRPKRIRIRPHGMTEADLISLMERNGIGRPSTYAFIVDALIERGYVENAGGSLVVTPRGRAVLEFLVDRYPSLFSVQFTARMEEMLDGIAARKNSYEPVVGQLHRSLK